MAYKSMVSISYLQINGFQLLILDLEPSPDSNVFKSFGSSSE